MVSGRSPAAAESTVFEVPPGKQNFEGFRYTALSLTDADKIRFRYKLEGFDSDWSQCGSSAAGHGNITI